MVTGSLGPILCPVPLTAMACDGSVAQCQPLRYPDEQHSLHMTHPHLLAGRILHRVSVILTSQLPFCGTHSKRFLWVPPLMEVVCSGPKVLEVVALVAALSTLAPITLSYTQIPPTPLVPKLLPYVRSSLWGHPTSRYQNLY